MIYSRIQSRSIIVSIRHGAAATRPGINPLTRTGLLTADFRLARGPASRRGRCAPGVRGLARAGRRRWTRSGAGTARVPGQISKESVRYSGELDGRERNLTLQAGSLALSPPRGQGFLRPPKCRGLARMTRGSFGSSKLPEGGSLCRARSMLRTKISISVVTAMPAGSSSLLRSPRASSIRGAPGVETATEPERTLSRFGGQTRGQTK